MKQPAIALSALLLLAWGGAALADAKFEHLAVRVEQNATDKDFEIVFEATGGDTGLAMLRVSSPDARVVIDFKSPNTKLGMRTIRLETPEPKSFADLRSEYPAGEYTFNATTVTGMGFSGTARLSHALPGVPTLVRPRPDETNVPLSGFNVSWAKAINAASCLVTVEDDQTGTKVIHAVLDGGATTLAIPDRLLTPGTRYKIAIGAVAKEGNASFVETAFTTAPR